MLPTKESLIVEFKSDRNKLSDSDIFEAVVAFANTEGGDLYPDHEVSQRIKTLEACAFNGFQNPICSKIYAFTPILRQTMHKLMQRAF